MQTGAGGRRNQLSNGKLKLFSLLHHIRLQVAGGLEVCRCEEPKLHSALPCEPADLARDEAGLGFLRREKRAHKQAYNSRSAAAVFKCIDGGVTGDELTSIP